MQLRKSKPKFKDSQYQKKLKTRFWDFTKNATIDNQILPFQSLFQTSTLKMNIKSSKNRGFFKTYLSFTKLSS